MQLMAVEGPPTHTKPETKPIMITSLVQILFLKKKKYYKQNKEMKKNRKNIGEISLGKGI